MGILIPFTVVVAWWVWASAECIKGSALEDLAATPPQNRRSICTLPLLIALPLFAWLIGAGLNALVAPWGARLLVLFHVGLLFTQTVRICTTWIRARRRHHRALSSQTLRAVRLALGAAAATLTALALPWFLPAALQAIHPHIHLSASSRDCRIYLTIDDAPSPDTRQILEVLERHGVRATFFVTSDHVESADALATISSKGHLLGNHLRTTKQASRLSLDEFKRDFDACAAAIEPQTPARLYRPSSDFGTPQQLEYVRSKGYRTVIGTVFPLDHWISSPWMLSSLIEWLAIPGGIIILHDGRERGTTTAEVLDRVIPKLKERGYTFDTLRAEAVQP